MTKAQKMKLLPEARKLHGDGYSDTRISEELKISRNTLAKWRSDDAGTANDWEARRKKNLNTDPFVPVRAARKRVNWLLDNQDRFLDDPGYDDRLNKALLNQDRIEARYGSADRIQEVLEQFGLHVRANVPADRFRCVQCGHAHDALQVLHDLSDDFMAAVRRGELELNV